MKCRCSRAEFGNAVDPSQVDITAQYVFSMVNYRTEVRPTKLGLKGVIIGLKKQVSDKFNSATST